MRINRHKKNSLKRPVVFLKATIQKKKEKAQLYIRLSLYLSLIRLQSLRRDQTLFSF